MTEREFLALLRRHGIFTESVFRRHEMNEVIRFTLGSGVDVGCGLNKIHTGAIGIDPRMGDRDFGYPFGAQIRAAGEALVWFADQSLDYVFSSHCLEHISKTEATLREWARVLRPQGTLVLILPHKDRYPNIGEPLSNPDHKHDFSPEEIALVLESLGFRILQIDTLHESLRKDPWATREAPKYGHKTLNFSFEVVARKEKDQERPEP